MVFGTIFWDYSGFAFNLGGRINLLYCFFWGIAAVVWLKLIYPKLSGCIEKIPKRTGTIVCNILIVFMIVNMLVGILELGVEEVMVIGHTDCGVQGMDGNEMLEKLVERGIDQQHIDIVRHSGIDLERWLGGFESVESSVHETVRRLKEHPLMPKNVRISGFIMDSATGELTRVEE